jgi:hypothetical protein
MMASPKIKDDALEDNDNRQPTTDNSSAITIPYSAPKYSPSQPSNRPQFVGIGTHA